MEYKGIPFIFSLSEEENEGEVAKGARFSLIADIHGGGYRGFMAGGLCSGLDRPHEDPGKKFGRLEGVVMGGIFTNTGNLTGLSVAGGANVALTEGDNSGVCVSGGVNYIGGNLEGVCATGVANVVLGELNGVSCGVYNHAGSSGRVAVQIGIANHIGKYNPDGAVIQIGLYNRAGEQTIPGINLRGLGRLFGKGKKVPSRSP